MRNVPGQPRPDPGEDMVAVGDWHIYLRLLSYVKPYWFIFLMSILGYIVYSACNVLLASVMQFILDAIGESSEVRSGLVSGAVYSLFSKDSGMTDQEFARISVPIVMIFLATLRGLGFFTGGYFINSVATSVVHNLRCELFDKFLVAKSAYYDENNAGSLISKITYNIEQVTGAVTKALKIIMREGFSVIMLFSYMLYVNWRLCLVFIAVAPFIAFIVAIMGKHFRRYSRRIQSSMGDVTQVSNESIGGYREVRLFGGRHHESDKFSRASNYYRSQSMKLSFADGTSTPIIQLLIAGALAALVWFSLSPEIMKNFTAGQFAAFLTAAGQLGKPIRQLSGVQSIVQRGLAAGEDLFYHLDLPAEPNEGEHTTERVKGHIEIDAVDFYYQAGGNKILDSVSMEVLPGQTVALVGKSGSGKSTLINLLTRLYPLSAGSIKLDGLPIETYELENLRSHIAQVSQTVGLFHDTIYNNIAYGGLADATPEAVLAAAQSAHAIEFIDDLPDGMQTRLGDDGGGLSGGQKQRLAIARAVLKDAPILVLDEATSALDNESEHRIQQALDTIMKNRTTIVIAHRLSTVENADRIFVMDQGKVVDSGSHAELLTRGGLYAQLYHQKFSS